MSYHDRTDAPSTGPPEKKDAPPAFLWAPDPQIEKERTWSRRQKRNALGEAIYIFAYLIYFVKYIVDASELAAFPDMIDNLFVVATLLCLFVKFFIQHYASFLQFFCISATTALLLFSCVLSENYLFLPAVMFVVTIRDVDLKKLLKLTILLKTLLIAWHVVWYIIVYLTDPDSIRYVYRGGSREKRHYFFLGHANMFTAFLTWLFLEFLYLEYKKINVLHLAFIWLVSLVFYQFTDSNTGVIVMAMVTVLIAWDKFGPASFSAVVTPITRYGHLVCTIVFPVLAAVYTRLGSGLKAVWDAVDHFFSRRLWYGAYAYDVYGPTFLGQVLKFPAKVFWGGRWFDSIQVFDNYYLGNFLSYGLANTLLISLVFFLLARKMESKGKIILVAYIFYGAMEAYITNVIICFPLLMVGKYLYQQLDLRPSDERAHRKPPARSMLWKSS